MGAPAARDQAAAENRGGPPRRPGESDRATERGVADSPGPVPPPLRAAGGGGADAERGPAVTRRGLGATLRVGPATHRRIGGPGKPATPTERAAPVLCW